MKKQEISHGGKKEAAHGLTYLALRYQKRVTWATGPSKPRRSGRAQRGRRRRWCGGAVLPCYRTVEEPSRVSRHCSSLDSSIVAVRDPSKSGGRGIDISVLARRGQAHVSSLAARGIDGIIEMTPGCFFVSLQSRSSLRERCLLRVSTFFVDNRCVSDSQDWKGTIDDAQATPRAGHPTAHPVLCDSLPTDRIRPHPVSAPVTHVTYGLAASLLPCAVTITARSSQLSKSSGGSCAHVLSLSSVAASPPHGAAQLRLPGPSTTACGADQNPDEWTWPCPANRQPAATHSLSV